MATEIKHEPRFRYDCGRCKFNQRDNLCCTCVLSNETRALEPTPKEVWENVNLAKLDKETLEYE